MEKRYYPYKDPETLTHTKRSIKKLHPYKLILALSLLGVSTLFIGLTIAFLLSQGTDIHFQLPSAFLLSTFFLMAGSAGIHLANKAFEQDHVEAFRWALAVTFFLTTGFLAAQAYGWQHLYSSGITISSTTAASYLFLLVGIHALHVLGGIAFLFIYGLKALKQVAHPAVALVFFTDPVQKLNLKLLTTYWHFIDGVWLYLMLVFLFQYL